jgi:GAF domain-containing protein
MTWLHDRLPWETEMVDRVAATPPATDAAASASTENRGTASAELVPLLSDYVDGVAARTAGLLGDVAGVAVTLKVDDGPLTVGASNDLAAEVDAIQYEVGTGPCLQTLDDGIGRSVADLGADPRWGDYGPRAAARGAASCVSLPVRVEGRPAAVLKVYSAQIDGISEKQRELAVAVSEEVAGGVALATHLCAQAHTLDDRETAMNTRRVIDLALGVLMERTKCDPDEAFALLRTQSQHRNIKLREVARQVLAGLSASAAEQSSPFTKPGARIS